MTLGSTGGSQGPALSALQFSPALPPLPPGLCGTRYGARKSQGCLQTGVLCLPPGCTCRARGKRLRSARARGQPEGCQCPRQHPRSTHPVAPEPRPGRGLPGGAGPSRPPRASRLPGDAEKKGWGPRAAGWGRRPQQQDAPSARPEGCCQGPFPAAEGQRARDRAASHSPRAAAAAATAWPGGSSLSRQPPPEGTGAAPGAAAKPPAPEGTVVAATTEAQRPPSLIGLTGRRSHAVPGGAPLNRAGGARLRRDDRGAAGGDPRRSLQRRRGRSCRRRRWATAPPAPHARLRRRDCGGRPCTSGGERGGARPGDGGGPALATLPSARGPPPTMPRGRQKPLDPRRSWRVLAPPPALGRERLCTFSFSPEDTWTFLSLGRSPERRRWENLLVFISHDSRGIPSKPFSVSGCKKSDPEPAFFPYTQNPLPKQMNCLWP